MPSWNRWHDIDAAVSQEADCYGIYKIRILDEAGSPIQISRVGGSDNEGIVYIGRSGWSKARSLSKRIGEFRAGKRPGGWPHSGRWTYDLMMKALDHPRNRSFLPHSFQYKTMHLDQSEKEIKRVELEAMAAYFVRFGELPPCNSSRPNWKEFARAVNRQARSVSR